MIVSTSDNKPKKTVARRVSTRKSVSPTSEKKVTVKKTVKNETAKAIKDIKEDVKEANDYHKQMDERVTRIKEDITIIDKRVKDIAKNGKETKRLNKEIELAQDELKKLENVDPNAGVVNTFKSTEDYKAYKETNKYLNTLKKKMSGSFGRHMSSNEDPLAEGFETSDIYSEMDARVKRYESELKGKENSGFYGRGLYKKKENIQKKIANISDSINKKMTPDVKKLLETRGINPEVIDSKVLDVNSRIKGVQSQIKEHNKTIKKLDSEIKKLDDHKVDVMTKTETLGKERAKIRKKKNEWVERQLNFISKNTEIKVDEQFIKGVMNPDAIMLEQRKRTIIAHGNNSKISEENKKIRNELFDWLDKNAPKQWKLYRAYMRSHHLYYDKKTDRIKYDDKYGDYWGTFENKELEISYDVEKPKNGNPVVYKLSSYGVITMADEGRNAFTAHGGTNTTHDMIALKDFPEVGEDTIVHGNVVVMPIEENNGLFCIGIKQFVKETIRKHKTNLNAQYGVIRKKIEECDEELKRIDDELKGIVQTDYDKYNRLENGKIDKLKRKMAYQKGAVTKLEKELSGLRKERRNLALTAGIIDLESEKQQLEENLSLYTDTRDDIKKLKKKINEEQSMALKKYKEWNREQKIAEATTKYNNIINGERYNTLKKKYEDSVNKYNAKILENNRKLKNTRDKLEKHILECSDELKTFDSETEALKARKKQLQQELKDIKKTFEKKVIAVVEHDKEIITAVENTKKNKKKVVKECVTEAVQKTEKNIVQRFSEAVVEKVNNGIEYVKEVKNNVFEKINQYVKESETIKKLSESKAAKSLQKLFGLFRKRR